MRLRSAKVASAQSKSVELALASFIFLVSARDKGIERDAYLDRMVACARMRFAYDKGRFRNPPRLAIIIKLQATYDPRIESALKSLPRRFAIHPHIFRATFAFFSVPLVSSLSFILSLPIRVSFIPIRFLHRAVLNSFKFGF